MSEELFFKLNIQLCHVLSSSRAICNFLSLAKFFQMVLDGTECEKGFNIVKFLLILKIVISVSEIVMHFTLIKI